MAFLSFRPALLHKLDPQQPAWPSPRSWMIANRLYKVGLDPPRQWEGYWFSKRAIAALCSDRGSDYACDHAPNFLAVDTSGSV